jgi:hypothetical protein
MRHSVLYYINTIPHSPTPAVDGYIVIAITGEGNANAYATTTTTTAIIIIVTTTAVSAPGLSLLP